MGEPVKLSGEVWRGDVSGLVCAVTADGRAWTHIPDPLADAGWHEASPSFAGMIHRVSLAESSAKAKKLLDVLMQVQKSAVPHYREHPAMTAAWCRMNAVLRENGVDVEKGPYEDAYAEVSSC